MMIIIDGERINIGVGDMSGYVQELGFPLCLCFMMLVAG